MLEQPQAQSADVKEIAQELMRQVRLHLAHDNLDEAIRTLTLLYPVDQAELLFELDRDKQKVLLNELPAQASGKILEQMTPQEAFDVFKIIEYPFLSMILDTTRPDVAADLLKQLPKDQSVLTLEAMQKIDDVTPLLGYPDETAGGHMTSSFVSVRDNMTAANALTVRKGFNGLPPPRTFK